MTEQNQSRNTETPQSTIRVVGVELSGSNHFRTTSRVHSEFTSGR